MKGKAAPHGHGGHEQAFGHGGAGPVEPQVGDSQIPQGKGRADALVQQIPGKDQVKIRQKDSRLFRQFFQGLLLHMVFRLFPGILPKVGIPAFEVEGMGQGPLRLLLSGDAGPGGDDGALGQGKALPSPFVTCHKNTFFFLHRW